MSRSISGSDPDFGPYDDEYRGFEIRDDDSGRGPLILLLALGVLLIFAGVVWNTYRQGVRPTQGGLPVIGESSVDFKRAPDSRGGLEVAEQDTGYYDLMDGGDSSRPKTVAMSNPPAIRRQSPTLAGAPETGAPPNEVVEPSVTKPAPVEFAEGLDSRVPPKADAGEVKTAALGPVAITEGRETSIPEASLPPPTRVASKFSNTGTFQVQLLASRSDTAARAAWDKIKASSPALYNGAELMVQRADLGAKGIFYRVRLGSFQTREAAKSFCDDVKNTGKDCIVVAKAVG